MHAKEDTIFTASLQIRDGWSEQIASNITIENNLLTLVTI